MAELDLAVVISIEKDFFLAKSTCYISLVAWSKHVFGKWQRGKMSRFSKENSLATPFGTQSDIKLKAGTKFCLCLFIYFLVLCAK